MAVDTSIDEFFDERLQRVLGAISATGENGSWYQTPPVDTEEGVVIHCRVIGCVVVAGIIGLSWQSAEASSAKAMDPTAVAREFGIIVGPLTEDVRKELNYKSSSGVPVFEVIGDSLAERSGIKAGSVVTQINKKRVHNLDELGLLLKQAMETGNFTVGTWEPATPDEQGSAQEMNFHFVPKRLD